MNFFQGIHSSASQAIENAFSCTPRPPQHESRQIQRKFIPGAVLLLLGHFCCDC